MNFMAVSSRKKWKEKKKQEKVNVWVNIKDCLGDLSCGRIWAI